MSNSILNNVKKLVGIDESYDVFDPDIVLFINSALSTLQQLGVGPEGGFSISDETAVWSDFLGNNTALNSVQTYIVLRVRLLFDPPQQSFVLTALQEQVKELEWRLEIARMTPVPNEPFVYPPVYLPTTPPVCLPPDPNAVYVLDGGGENSE